MLLQGNNLISILHVFHGLHCESHTGDLYKITSHEHLVEEPMNCRMHKEMLSHINTVILDLYDIRAFQMFM